MPGRLFSVSMLFEAVSYFALPGCPLLREHRSCRDEALFAGFKEVLQDDGALFGGDLTSSLMEDLDFGSPAQSGIGVACPGRNPAERKESRANSFFTDSL